MTITILCVHGGGNLRAGRSEVEAAEMIATSWKADLAANVTADPSEFEVQVAYYSHHTNPVDDAQGPLGLDELDDRELRAVVAWLAAQGVSDDVSDAQGKNLRVVRQLLSWLVHRDRLNPSTAERFVARYFRELCRYFDSPDVRSHVHRTVAEAVERHSPTVIIAHSLGCVVAYETLWQYRPQGVKLLLTMGAPLALPHVVFDRLLPPPQDGRGAKPPTVERWINISDPGDLVAVPKPLTAYFAGLSADVDDAIASFDFHSARRYLRCAATAVALSSHL